MIPVRIYYSVFAALLILTLTTAAAAYVNLGGTWNVTLALTIAVAKATLVTLYFMHLRYSSRVTVLFACAGLFWLLLLLLLTLSDFLTRDSLVH